MLRCKIFLILLISGLLIFGPAKGFASPEEMQILVNTLVEKGQLTQDEADAVMTAIKKHIPQQEKTRVETGKLPAVTTVTAVTGQVRGTIPVAFEHLRTLRARGENSL